MKSSVMNSGARLSALALAVGLLFLVSPSLLANHPVLVEGNCGAPGLTAVPPGTCGDFDGDGRIGTAEDIDEADRVFGTINAALGPGTFGTTATGANQNGTVTIVASGRFGEVVSITGANGNVTLQAAPGVEANIDAVIQGDTTPPGNAGRQAMPGIIVNSPADRYVIIRNITSRNWTSGIQVLGDSRVAIENCRMENNVNFGIEVADRARVVISRSEIHATGFRTGGAGNNFPTVNAPAPGRGIEFKNLSSGVVAFTTVSGSFAAGISNTTNQRTNVCIQSVSVFDNSPNLDNIRTSFFSTSSCQN